MTRVSSGVSISASIRSPGANRGGGWAPTCMSTHCDAHTVMETMMVTMTATDRRNDAGKCHWSSNQGVQFHCRHGRGCCGRSKQMAILKSSCDLLLKAGVLAINALGFAQASAA